MRRLLVLTFLAVAAATTAVQAQTPVVVEYYHPDALGSVRAVTNAQGQIVRRHDFMPFGEEFNQPFPPGERHLYTGKERDHETGLDYFGARYYRAGVGRFTTIDPMMAWQSALGNPQLWNRYAYALSNPLRYTDPDGRCIWDVCVGEGMAVWAIGATAVATTAWLVSPSGQRAVRDVVSDTGTIIAAAAGGIRSWFLTEKRPGTLGKPDHRATVEEEANRIAGTPEVRIETPGGKKSSRRADAVGTNPTSGEPEIVQVYRPTPAGKVPKREKEAAGDIEKARGVKPTMVPVRPLTPKKVPKEEVR